MIYTIKSDKLTVSVSSLGAELTSIKSPDFEYLWQKGIWKDQAPILFPACGRITNNTYTYRGKEYKMGIHGFARRMEFDLVEHSESRLVLSLSDTPESRESYPFAFTLTAEYTIEGDTLGAKYTVTNNDEKPMPFMFGWHPGFNLWGDAPIESYTLDFGDVSYLTHHVTNELKCLSGAVEAFPLKDGKYTLCEAEIYDQDALIFTESLGKVTLSEPTSSRAVTVTWSDNLPYVAFWKWASSDVRYLCVEPWSGVPGDGVTPEVWEERKNITIGSGVSESFVYTVKCE